MLPVCQALFTHLVLNMTIPEREYLVHLQTKKLHKELIYSSHTARKWQSKGLKPGHWAPDPKCPPFPLPRENMTHKLEMPRERSGIKTPGKPQECLERGIREKPRFPAA